MTPTARADTASNRPASAHVPGEVGTWVFIFGDVLVFSVFFATYLYYFGEDPDLFREAQGTLTQAFGAINTALLLTSSLCVALSVKSLRAGETSTARRLVPLALACGAGFMAFKVIEYSQHVSNGETAGVNDFYLYFYVLTGVHAFHLAVGMCGLSFIWRTACRSRMTERQFGYVEGAACFWHLVDLLWIVLFPLLYLVG